MNKYIAIIALLSFATAAQAQTGNIPARNPSVMREGTKVPLQQKRIATTTRPVMQKTKLMASSTRPMMASTTRPAMPIKRELKPTAKKEVAVEIKDRLVERLSKALDTFTTVKNNLSTRIEKNITEGKPVGNAKVLLATATAKIEAARKAVAAVVAWKPDAKTASSTEIALAKPRATANAAIKAVNDARLALVAVMQELRKASGGQTATTTISN